MLRSLLAQDTIEVEKHSKKGVKLIDIKPQLGDYTLEKLEDCVQLVITLPAGSVNNVNPSLLVAALENSNNTEVYADITRLDVFDEEGKSFE